MTAAALVGLLVCCGCGPPPSAVKEDPRDAPLRDPDEADELAVRLELAAHMLHSGNTAAAKPLLQRILRDNPNSGLAHHYLGLVLEAREQLEPAEREYRAAVRDEPKLHGSMSRLGMLLAQRGQHDEAVKWLQRATETEPRQASYHNNLGYALFLAGRPEQALAVYEKAASLDPTARVTYNNLGFAYGKLGRLKEARRAFAQAGRPAMVETNMGLVYELLGRPVQAEAAYREALRLRPGHAAAKRNLEALQAGRKAPPSPVEPTSEQGKP